MPEIAAKLVSTVVDNTVRKAQDTTGKAVAEQAVKKAFEKDALKTAGKTAEKAAEAPIVELPKIKLKNPVQLVVGAGANIDAPRISPDKSTITYVVRETKDVPTFVKKLLGLPVDEPTEKMTAWVAPMDGKTAPQQIAGKTFHNVVEPSFTPDGKSIIYCQQKNVPFLSLARGEKLKAMRLDQRDLATGTVKTIYDGDLTMLHPMYSPDGKAIAAYSRDPGHEGIYLLDPAGKVEPRRLTMGDDKHPVWSNDGKTIYFHNQKGGDAVSGGGDSNESAWLGKIDLSDAKNPQRVMLDDVKAPNTYHKHPTPLPNSDLVVYHSTADDKTKLEVLNTVTGQRARLDLEGTSPNGSPLKKFKHAQFSGDGEELLMVGKSSKKDALDRGIPEYSRVYVLQEANQIVDAFKGVFGQ